MAFNTGSGTELDPYIIENVSMWNNDVGGSNPTMAPGEYAKVQDGTDIDFAGGGAERLADGKIIDLNGQALLNIGNFLDAGANSDVFIRNGSISNGRIDVYVTRATGGLWVFQGDASANTSLRITGSLTNTGTGNVGTLQGFVSGTSWDNCISELDLLGNADVTGWSGRYGFSSFTADKLIFNGTLGDQGGGTATLYGFGNSDRQLASVTNSFWNTTKTGVTNDSGGATGKTTTELQDIATYTDTATVGLDSAYDMVSASTYVDETWSIASNSFPVLSFDYVAPSAPLLTVTIDSVAESGVDVVLMQFDDKNLLNPVVIDKGVTDVNGDYTYTGGIDDTKVFGYIVNKPNSGDASLANGAFRLATLNVS